MLPETTTSPIRIRQRIPPPGFDDADALAAELSAVLVDLAARARYGKVEGAALPLLAHAHALCEQLDGLLDGLLDGADPRVGAKFGPQLRALRERLTAVDAAFTRLPPPS